MKKQIAFRFYILLGQASSLTGRIAIQFYKSYGPKFSTLILLTVLQVQIANSQSALINNNSLSQFLSSADLKSAHVGVYVYDDSSKKIIADYQSDKYFVPASNVKLFSLYAGMKYLGDSLTGLTYVETDTSILISPTGDPSFLHPDFQSQPVFDFLKKATKPIYFIAGGWNELPFGPGWAWDDYNDDYSTERSEFPIYGNFIRWTQQHSATRNNSTFEPTGTVFSSPEIPWKVRFTEDSLTKRSSNSIDGKTSSFQSPTDLNKVSAAISSKKFLVTRTIDSNVFNIRLGKEIEDQSQDVPFITHDLNAAITLLPDTLGKPVFISTHYVNSNASKRAEHPAIVKNEHRSLSAFGINFINSRPVDSVFMPMMFRSDNFFAEQILLMVGNQLFHYMNEGKTIDSLLSTSLSDLPQKPSWVDGCGLSRYNLFSPQDFVTLLIKFKNEFGIERMKRILPTGGKGTLKNYYHADSGFVFAKTGSMSGVMCLTGYVYTAKKHLLEFSILINNNVGSSSGIKREIESFVESMRRNN